MNVYTAEPAHAYSGGVVLIAAPRRREADAVLEAWRKKHASTTDFEPCTLLRGVKSARATAGVLFSRYYVE